MSRSGRAHQFKIKVEPPSTLKDHCELIRGLTGKPDTVLESRDNSEQNQRGYFFDFFLKFFCTGPLKILFYWLISVNSYDSETEFNDYSEPYEIQPRIVTDSSDSESRKDFY